MAGHESIKVINDLKEGALQCSLCLDLLDDPRVLNCLHRFCRKCIDDLCLKGNPTGSAAISCPNCRQKSHVPAGGAKMLKSDFVLRDILERIQVKNHTVVGTCGSCSNTGELAKFCKECQCVICDACVQQHSKMRVLQSHTLESLGSHHMPSQSTPTPATRVPNTAAEKAASSGKMKCPIHSDETIYYQCSSCDDKLICNTCLNSIHRNHITKTLDEVMSALKTTITEELEKISAKTTNNKNAVKLTRAKRQEVITNAEKSKTRVTEVSKEMTEFINQQSQQLVLQIDEKKETLVTALSSIEEVFEKELARSSSVRQKVSRFLASGDADTSKIAAAREHLKELQDMSTREKNLPTFDWIRKQQLGFRPTGGDLSVGVISTSNTWIQKTYWDIGMVNAENDAITGLVTLPSGKLLVAISRKTQATYAIISVKDGSSGWKKNFSVQNFPPHTPCYATSLEKGVIIMAWNHVITRYDMATNKSTSYGMKVPTGSSVQSIAADEAEERIVVSHSSKNELRLFDGELTDARETPVLGETQRITKIFSQKSAKTFLLCDDQGNAFAVNKYTGETLSCFKPPEPTTKGHKFVAKSVCGSQDGHVFVLWSSPKLANVVQYLSCGIPVSRISVDTEAALMSVVSINDKECLVVCSSKGAFKIYFENE